MAPEDEDDTGGGGMETKPEMRRYSGQTSKQLEEAQREEARREQALKEAQRRQEDVERRAREK
jgi:hypothetical protein